MTPKIFFASPTFLVTLVLLFVMAAVMPGFAQSTSATISGTITDQSGAFVTGAMVVATNEDTGVATQTTTNNAGVYHVPNLIPGKYRVAAAKEGFRQVVVRDITLNIQDVLNRNFTLQVGAFSEIVQVEGSAMTINTTDASVSTVVDQTYVQNMPLNGRSFQDLILLTPGVVTTTPQNSISRQGAIPGGEGEFSVNGQRLDENYYTVDGVSANLGAQPGNILLAGPSGSVEASTIQGTTQALVSIDALQEFRVQSSTYSAEYGRTPGGQFAFQTKSGTKQWHGTGFDYLRNGFFDAQDWFDDYFQTPNGALRQNDFGGTFGGPVRIPHIYNGKDKTFFFFSYEGLRLTNPVPAQNLGVPDLCLRGNNAACIGGETPADPAVQSTLNAYPIPNGPEFPGTGLAAFRATWSNPSSINSTSIRLDHVVNDKLHLFFRFSNTDSSAEVRGTAQTSPSEKDFNSGTVRTYTVGATSLFSIRWSNEFRLNYSSNETGSNATMSPFGGSSPVNLQALSNLPPGAGIFFDDCCQQGTLIVQGPSFATQHQWNLVDTVSFSAGRHQFKFGGDFRRLTPSAGLPTPQAVTLFFGPPSLEANQPITQAFVADPAFPLYKNFSLFAQDEWKATSRLSLSMGLRWEVNPPPGATRGLMPYTYQGTSLDNYQAAPQGTPLWHTAWFNFAPRLGVAYGLRERQGWETVLRSGAGVYFDTGNQAGSAGFTQPGFQAVNTFFSNPYPLDFNAPGVFPVVAQPPTGAPYGLTGFSHQLQLPYTIQWNASIEQGLGKDQTFTTSFVGSHGARLLQTDAFNIPNANTTLSGFNLVHNASTSDYYALQLQFQRRLSKGLTALASYGWSHCFDYDSYNSEDTRRRGNCSFDVRNNFSAAFSYDVPNVGHNGFANAVLHHWGLDNRFTARSAFPFNVASFNTAPLPDGQRLQLPIDFTGEPVYLFGSTCNQVMVTLGELQPGQPCPGGVALDPCAFLEQGSEPTQTCVDAGMGGTQGPMLPRNSLRGLGAWQMDMAVRREFPIGERFKLQFRAEAFNIFNHPNFGVFDYQMGSPTFGLALETLATSVGQGGLSPIYQMGGNRSMQFALKLVF